MISQSRSSAPATRGRAAFTIIELLLVVVILGIATAVAIPSFVGSFEGASLRTASRTVAMATRYARSTAVLQQKDVALIFYPDRNEVEMVSIRLGTGADERNRFLEGRRDRAVDEMLGRETDPDPEVAAPAPSIESELVRALPERVRIVDVEVDGEVIDIEGSYLVNFYSNGMTDPFVLRLADEDDRESFVAVDPLSGRVEVSFQRPGGF